MSGYKDLLFCLIGISLLQNFVSSDYYKHSDLSPHQTSLSDELRKNQIDHVQLNHRNISQITRDLLWELTMVEQLEIQHSNVHSIEPGSFQRLTYLKKLSLKHNLLEEIKNNIFTLPTTEELDLRDNQIRTIEDDAFIYMRNLKSINLRNNKLEVYSNRWFRHNTKLCSINLENNLIKAISESITRSWFIPSCNVDFVLSHNRIKEVSEEAFPDKWSFNRLYLDHNAITEIKNETFARPSVIKDLRLDYNQIVCTTADIKTVENINVNNNPWNEKCLLTFLQQKNIQPPTIITPLLRVG